MSPTVVPDLNPRNWAICPDSLNASRCSSLERLGLTMSATGRCGRSKASAASRGESHQTLYRIDRVREICELLRTQGERVERDHHTRHRDDCCEHGARGLHGHVAFPLSEAAAYQEGYALTAATLTSTRYWRCSRK